MLQDRDEFDKSLKAFALNFLENSDALKDLSLPQRFQIQSTVNAFVNGLDEGNKHGVLALFLQVLLQNSLQSDYIKKTMGQNLGLLEK